MDNEKSICISCILIGRCEWTPKNRTKYEKEANKITVYTCDDYISKNKQDIITNNREV